jgi:hypothetical protein
MSNFGNKFNKSSRTLGNKFDNGTRRLGDKIIAGIGKTNTFIRKADNTLHTIDQKGTRGIPGISAPMAVASNMTHLVHLGTNAAKNKDRNRLEKYNSRKRAEDKQLKSAVMEPGFI